METAIASIVFPAHIGYDPQIVHVYHGRSLRRALLKDASISLSDHEIEVLEDKMRLVHEGHIIRLHVIELD